MAASSVFVDTNILIYVRTTTSVWHAAAVARMNQMTAAGIDIYISRQILREFLAAMTRPATGVTTPAIPILIADIQVFQQHLRVVEDNAAVTTHLLALLGQVPCAGKQVHDANIVATMVAHGISSLPTNNPSDFSRFAGFITVILSFLQHRPHGPRKLLHHPLQEPHDDSPDSSRRGDDRRGPAPPARSCR